MAALAQCDEVGEPVVAPVAVDVVDLERLRGPAGGAAVAIAGQGEFAGGAPLCGGALARAPAVRMSPQMGEPVGLGDNRVAVWTGSRWHTILKSMPKINLSISLSEDMSQAVDRVRGDVQRSVWVRRAIQQRL